MDRMEDEDLIEILCAYVAVSDGLRDEMFLRVRELGLTGILMQRSNDLGQ